MNAVTHIIESLPETGGVKSSPRLAMSKNLQATLHNEVKGLLCSSSSMIQYLYFPSEVYRYKG